MEKRDKILKAVKITAMLIAGVATGAVVTAVIRNSIQTDDLTKVNKVLISVGTVIISGMVADAGRKHVGDSLDDIFNEATEAMKALNTSLNP